MRAQPTLAHATHCHRRTHTEARRTPSVVCNMHSKTYDCARLLTGQHIEALSATPPRKHNAVTALPVRV
eukprot:13964525-Alexandrium_andersonii.AAC.1